MRAALPVTGYLIIMVSRMTCLVALLNLIGGCDCSTEVPPQGPIHAERPEDCVALPQEQADACLYAFVDRLPGLGIDDMAAHCDLIRGTSYRDLCLNGGMTLLAADPRAGELCEMIEDDLWRDQCRFYLLGNRARGTDPVSWVRACSQELDHFRRHCYNHGLEAWVAGMLVAENCQGDSIRCPPSWFQRELIEEQYGAIYDELEEPVGQVLRPEQHQALRGLFDLHVALLQAARPADWRQVCQRSPVLGRHSTCVAPTRNGSLSALYEAPALRWGQEEPRWW